MEKTPKKQSDKQRRDFLKKLSAFSAAVGVASTSKLVMADAKIAPKEIKIEDPHAALGAMVTHAIDKLDVEAAIKEHNSKAKLNDKQLGAFRAFTKDDLKALGALRAKYVSLKQQVPQLPQAADTAW